MPKPNTRAFNNNDMETYQKCNKKNNVYIKKMY